MRCKGWDRDEISSYLLNGSHWPPGLEGAGILQRQRSGTSYLSHTCLQPLAAVKDWRVLVDPHQVRKESEVQDQGRHHEADDRGRDARHRGDQQEV